MDSKEARQQYEQFIRMNGPDLLINGKSATRRQARKMGVAYCPPVSQLLKGLAKSDPKK